jgi:hypothetical protein
MEPRRRGSGRSVEPIVRDVAAVVGGGCCVRGRGVMEAVSCLLCKSEGQQEKDGGAAFNN